MKKRVLSVLLTIVMTAGLAACGGTQDAPKSSTGSEDNTETKDEPADETKTDEASEESESAMSDMPVPEVPEIEGSDVEATFKVCTFYGNESTELAEFAAEQIKRKFPNVKLEFETLPSDGGQTIKTRAATGDLPEILLVDSGTIKTLSESGSIYPIDEYVEKFNIGNYYTPAIMENCLYSPDEKVYQFPMGSISPILWYYNKQVFEENGVKVPENFDELLEATKKFKEKDIIPMAMFGKEPWPLGAFFDSFAVKENPGGCFALSEGEAKAADETYQRAIDKMEQLISTGIFQEGATNTDFDAASALFKDGKCAMFLNGSWYTADGLDGLGDNLDIMTFYPTSDADSIEENQYAMTGGGDTNGMAITNSAKDKDLAASIAFLFAYYREVAQYQKNSLVTTPLKTDNLVLQNKLDPVSQKLLDVIGNYSYKTRFLHTLPNTKFATSFTEEMQKFLVGESKEDFSKNIDKNIEKTVE